jgi:hypothetical protein
MHKESQPCMQWTAALPYRTMHDHHIAQNLAEPRNQSSFQPSQSKCQPASHSKASNPADGQQANLIRFNPRNELTSNTTHRHLDTTKKPASQNCRQQTKQAN